MNKLVSILLLLTSICAISQNFEKNWTGYFSYVSIKSIAQGNDKIFAASENSVFTYDLSTKEIETISTINGLSGEQISTIYYSEDFRLLVIGYENGLIEIFSDRDDSVLTVVDILDKPTIPPDRKRINHFNEYNGKLYIAAQFGISIFDLASLEFGDSYFIGDQGERLNITQTTVLEPYVFAASTDGGIRVALVDNDNLIDFRQWSEIATGSFLGVQTLGNEVFAASPNNAVFRVDENGILGQVITFPETINGFTSTGETLTITTQSSVQSYIAGFTQQAQITNITDFEYALQFGFSYNNNFYLGTTNLGMLVVPFSGNSAEQILPDGPIRNDPFAIDASPGQLWAVFGDVDISFNPFPLSQKGISNLKNGSWKNIPFEELRNANDLVDVIINPQDTSVVYATSHQKGLLRIEGQTPSILYDETNSPLNIPGGNRDLGIRLYGMAFDRQGNLWFVQSRTNDALIKLSPTGQFEIIDISSIIDGEDELALSEIKISREGFVFFGAVRSGLVGYDPQSKKFNIIKDEIGQGNLPTNNIRSLAFDNQNRLWIGTLAGLRVLFNVGGFFEDDATVESQEIIILDDGVPQELLFQQSVTDIEVDGSNNKWLATATSGVFYVSSNGQETLLRFTKENSPLPSNTVQDIAIDDASGVVYFATPNGLVAYNGTATAAQETLESVYAFPNPVRPNFNGNVTIDKLTAGANVKITDLEGNLVFEQKSVGGSILWDTTAFGKYKVASGVYFILVTTEDLLETKVAKIMVIR